MEGRLHFGQAIFLLFAGIAGALNALAGGGSFISFPALFSKNAKAWPPRFSVTYEDSPS